ncbi:hypothetical protein AVEN_40550-1 [Araneus ventricosus]|uniref:Uncharacterized protein n=1 Tax=Araneus ventricosus TaxID=182803 RepID=A0A4Y2M7K1_ARAVE|nr:hypothetical protein AVEN_40550-1 [Araneus ventricosus]
MHFGIAHLINLAYQEIDTDLGFVCEGDKPVLIHLSHYSLLSMHFGISYLLVSLACPEIDAELQFGCKDDKPVLIHLSHYSLLSMHFGIAHLVNLACPEIDTDLGFGCKDDKPVLIHVSHYSLLNSGLQWHLCHNQEPVQDLYRTRVHNCHLSCKVIHIKSDQNSTGNPVKIVSGQLSDISALIFLVEVKQLPTSVAIESPSYDYF